MKVYVLYLEDTYVDFDGNTEPPSVMGVFSSVEKIQEFMNEDTRKHFARDDSRWVYESKSCYPHDVICYFEEFELDKGE